ncbi:MAG: hypothetical protein QOD74_2854 [Variibacter sp.]|jgi:hypothetical protein|nr:hypothetical protein [Variibacter sp.]
MTTIGDGGAVARTPTGWDHEISLYQRKKEELWNYFYGLPSAKRFRILVDESKYLFAFWLGYLGCMFLWKHVVLAIPVSRYVPFLAQLFDIRAFAQTQVAPETLAGLTSYQWRLAVWLIFHMVLVIILMGCVGHMLYSTRARPWVAKTATFLLGFLVKALTGLTP